MSINSRIRDFIYRNVLADEVPLEAKMINMIFLAGTSFASVAIITRIFMGASVFLLLVVLSIIVSIVCLMAAGNRFRLYTIFSWIAIIVICDILLPAAYFALGGVASSAPAYFVLSMVIIILLSKGKSSAVFLITHILWVVFCYYSSYRFPNLVIRLGDFEIYQDIRVYQDHIQSIVIVGGCICVIIKIQNKIYLVERDKADNSRRQVLLRDDLLHMVNDAAVMLIASEAGQFEESLSKSMESMARCVDADHVCIWKNMTDREASRYMKLFEWLNDKGLLRNKDAKSLPFYFDGLPSWEREFALGRTVNGPLKNLSPGERSLLPFPALASILAIPIFLQDHYWGFVSFGDYRKERRFSAQEEKILQSGSLLIANAAARNEMTQDLIQAREEALNSTRAKSVFLARMSHEIRTPLNAILGLSEVELQDNLPDKTRLNLEKIYHSGSHLLEIVNDILDISKIESGNFEIVPTEYELSTVINYTIRINVVRIGLKQIVFKLELDETIPAKLYGDELRIKQILSNLLSNAFKYTEEGEVSLGVGWERRNDAALLDFTVRDTGRGIKQADMEKLFSEYTQFDAAANRRIEGTGLGLSIARGLVETMGGTITVESEYGKGSVFRISLPQGIVDETPIGREAAENLENFRFADDRTRSRGNIIRSWMPYGKVLVVDDLPTNLDVMTGLLMPYGLRVDTVLSGREAVNRITAGEVRYDLVFMDHMMPEMDGVEAARFIRNEIGTDYAKTVPIVVLTANAIAGNRELFLESGFNDFIPKPIDIKQLDMVLNQWVRDKQSEETLREAENRAGERAEGAAQATQGDADAEGRWLLDHPVEGVDFSAALILYGGSGAALVPILTSFAIHTPPLLEKMDAHLETSLPDYAVEVHGLKGTCNAVCAGEAAALARELETAAVEGNAGFVRSRHDKLRQQALDLTKRLKALLAEWEARRPVRVKEERAGPDRELLARLSGAAAGFNSNVVEEVLGELVQYRYQRGEEL
ncbi:MAG: response regulator, partial [Treponema sp.]|nr:response regulator [Treponema sp.]